MEKPLISVLNTLKIEKTDTISDRFAKYCEHLIEVNKVMNLTAITDPNEIYLRHFADSVSLLGCADFDGKKVIDIGTGAGFPGLPIKIANDSISLTLLDSLRKRVDFLSEACEILGLDDVTCLHARAEEQASKEGFRDSFDIVLSRAVASLPTLCELCLPYVKPGGLFLAMKSRDYAEELNGAENAIKTLQGRVERVCEYNLDDVPYCVIVIKKLANTPTKYPRRFAKIQKSPL